MDTIANNNRSSASLPARSRTSTTSMASIICSRQTFSTTSNSRASGLAGFKEVGRMMNRVFPDVIVTEEDLIADEGLVVERSSAVATHRASMMNEPPTNKQIRWTEIHIYRIRNGKITEHWVEMSMLELLKQIGAI